MLHRYLFEIKITDFPDDAGVIFFLRGFLFKNDFLRAGILNQANILYIAVVQ